MNNYFKHIDDFFREKLGRYRETPPADVWDALDKRLDGLAPAPARPTRWLWHAAAILLVLVASLPLVKKYTSKNTIETKDAIVANNTATQPMTGTTNTPTVTGNNNTAAQNSTGTAANTPQTEANAVASNDAATTANTHQSASRHAVSSKKAVALQQLAHKIQAATNNNSTVNNATTAYNQHSYNGSTANPAPIDETNDQSAAASPGQTLSSATKPNAQQPSTGALKKESAPQVKTVAGKTATANKQAAKKSQDDFARIEAGLKIGYETGTDNGVATKYVIAPYLQYNLSQKFALMIQPAFKEATVAGQNIGGSQSYYKVNNDGQVSMQYINVNAPVIGGVRDTVSSTVKYSATQSHDSIVKSHRFGGSYSELELPVLLKYNICKRFSVYGGVNILYSRTASITEETYTTYGIMKSGSVTDDFNGPAPRVNPSAEGVIGYAGTSIKEYQNPYATTAQSTFRAGYMLGFTYNCNKRWLFDALMESSHAKAQNVANYNINTPLSATYFRLSVGYQLTK